MHDYQQNHKTAGVYRNAQVLEAQKARRAQPTQEHRQHVRPALARVGKLLSAMGNALQERYGALEEKPALQEEYYGMDTA